jgi:hypothetical protein
MSDPRTSFGILQMIQRVTFPFNTIYDGEITLDQYFQDIYIQPGLTLIEPNGTSKLENQYSIPQLVNQKVVLTGAMGAGKSTYLLWLYSEMTKLFEVTGSPHRACIFSLPQYFENPDIKKFITGTPGLVLFIDSLDETVLSLDKEKIQEALDLFLSFPSVIIACRSPFFYDLFQIQRRSVLNKIVQLEPLTLDKQRSVISKYLSSPFFKNIGANTDPEETAFEIIKKCRGNKVAETTIIATPLFSALSSIVATNNKRGNKLSGVVDVYRLFIADVTSRKFSDGKAASKLSELAFNLNTAYLQNNTLSMEDITDVFGGYFSEAVRDILQIKKGAVLDNVEIIIDFRHRSIGEYLLAKYIVSKLVNRNFSEEHIGRSFDRLFNYEVSFFIRSLFDEIKSAHKIAICDFFKSFIRKNITAQGDVDILAVHNCVYFLRFLLTDWKAYALEIGDELFKKKENIHPLILGTFLSGVISSEAIAIQVKFLEANRSDNDIRLVNRNLNYYLFYYGDSEYKDPPDFVRDISWTTSWDNTRTVLLTRLKDDSPKKRLFRCHDLIILRQFLERTKDNVPAVDIATILDIMSDKNRMTSDTSDSSLRNAILLEIREIENLLRPTLFPAKNAIMGMKNKKTYIVIITPNWGYEEGGINAFNFDFSLALSKVAAATDYGVICVTLISPNHDRAEELKAVGGVIFSLKKSNSEIDIQEDIRKTKEMIRNLPSDSHIVFVGHDIFTGAFVNLFTQEFSERSTSVIFHHMDYQSYYAIKGPTAIFDIKKKISDQKKILKAAQIAVGIGPKLFASVVRQTKKEETERHFIIPGLQQIDVKDEKQGNLISALTSAFRW